ncbi:transposase family protein [Puniceibacterium sp. IMCC21224]|nr:transposase family protein [Puniceibacterium sp. IMCC21224]
MPCSRQSSATGTPPSAWRSIARIWGSCILSSSSESPRSSCRENSTSAAPYFRGGLPPDWSNRGWHQHETARHLRQLWTSAQSVRDRRSPLSAMQASPAGQWYSDYIGARALLSSLPDVDWLLGDRGYDADWFREALKDKGIRACIPGRKQRKTAIRYDKRRYKRRNRPSRDIAAQCTAGQ